MAKRCPDCKQRLRPVGDAHLNFAHPLVGGNPLKALFWAGDTQGLILIAAFAGAYVLAAFDLFPAAFITVLFATGWAILSALSPKPLFKCPRCKVIFAGRRRIRYDAGDDVYR